MKRFLQKIILVVLLHYGFCVSSQSVGGIATGAAVYCDSVNSGFISLTGYSGQIQYWQTSINNGLNWANISNATSTQSYYHLKQTTSFRAVVKDGAFPEDVSTVSTITVHVAGSGGKLKGGGIYCSNSGIGALNLEGSLGNILYWQYSVDGSHWTTLNHTNSSLSYTNIMQNTQYRVVVSDVASCPADTSTISGFTIDPKTVTGSILESDSVCYGSGPDSLRLNGYTGSITDWMYSKDNGISWQTLNYSDATYTYSLATQTLLYKAKVKSGVCAEETTSPTRVAVYNSNAASAGSDITITKHEKITLHGTGNGHPIWSHASSLDDPHSFTPLAQPSNTTTYILTLIDDHGCSTKDSVTINVIIPIPSAITPNGDGRNDFFVIDKITEYESNSLMIFDRWGKLVYKAAPYQNTWNGKSQHGSDLPDDFYYYLLDYGNGEAPVTNYILIKR
jgi:gliding motility-associated-like protein